MNADRIAHSYRWFEYIAFGRSLEMCRFTFLSQLRTTRRILILGEGDGRFLARLVQENSEARIDVVEMNAKMIAVAKDRLRTDDLHRITFHQRDASSNSLPPGKYDLVVTNFFLDCLSDSQACQIIPKISAAIEPHGKWIVSEFQTPPSGLKKLHASLWIRVMYLFFGIVTRLKVNRIPGLREYVSRRWFHFD